jgi:hypothetical protein
MNIIRGENCGNSPKNLFIEQVEVAYCLGNVDFLREAVKAEIQWEIIGECSIQGAEALAQSALEMTAAAPVIELNIEYAFTHGKAVAVSGMRRIADGRIFKFCTICTFTSVKGDLIQKADHYQIQVG